MKKLNGKMKFSSETKGLKLGNHFDDGNDDQHVLSTVQQ